MNAIDNKPVKAVLFDLDGTLLDTAPDLGAALNYLCRQYQQPEISAETYTPIASHGSRGLLNLAFAEQMSIADSAEAKQLREKFLSYYNDNIAHATQPFKGVAELLQALKEATVEVAIVTNKPKLLTARLLPYFNDLHAIKVVVSGDTLTVSKPHPEPLLYAAKQLGVAVDSCVYVGDAERDIEAGRNAGMVTVLAGYGYISDQDQPQRWGADYTIEHPLELLKILSIDDLNRDSCAIE
ncbi:MAG: HAD family hydrolase [Pseudomonadota bacterium]